MGDRDRYYTELILTSYLESKSQALADVLGLRKIDCTHKGKAFLVLSTKDEDYLVVTREERAEYDMYSFYKVWDYLGASNDYCIYRLRTGN